MHQIRAQSTPETPLPSARPALIALLIAIVLAVIATTPPAPRAARAPSSAFSAERAMGDVRAVARAPHITGSTENARVRGYLLQRLAALGLQTSTQAGWIGPASLARHNRWTGQAATAVPLTNIIGVLPGRDRSLPAVLLMAHHDSVWGSPGAADDAAGLAATLEAVRAIKAGELPPRDLIVLFTDAEELGLEGARLFWTAHPLRHRVGVVLNMEARGGGGRATMFQTSRQNGAAAGLYAAAVRQPATSSLAAFVYSVLPNDTDLTEVLKGPATGYNFAFIGRSGLYHSPLATPDRLDQGALQDMGQQVLDLTRALLQAKSLPGRAPDAVFFDLFGKLTVIYPAWVGWWLLGAAGVAYAIVLRQEGAHGVWLGAARMVGLLAVAVGTLAALNHLSLGPGPSNYYDRLAAIPRLEAIALIGCLATALLLFGRSALTPAEQTGAALPLLLLGVATQALAPTAAYVIALPLLLSALALNIAQAEARAVLAALAVGYMLALGHQLMEGVGPTMPMVASLPLALAVLAFLPVWTGLRRARAVAGILLLAAAGFALWVQLDAPATSRAIYADHKT